MNLSKPIKIVIAGIGAVASVLLLVLAVGSLQAEVPLSGMMEKSTMGVTNETTVEITSTTTESTVSETKESITAATTVSITTVEVTTVPTTVATTVTRATAAPTTVVVATAAKTTAKTLAPVVVTQQATTKAATKASTVAPTTATKVSVGVSQSVATKAPVDGTISVTKIDKVRNTPISGVQFTISSVNGTTRTLTTDANGVVTFLGLPAGRYTVTEIFLPDGYKAITQTQVADITAQSLSVSLTSYASSK